ncbi:4Fe-4S dicluster domain-containing protein [Enteractinococcus fodinae]|uniref:Formate dehydrogenase iron-sulfur subunit n=1 Tax=Enteractinococcus fodinae TaxID=684663 RepID=A0ABU2AXT7_9MICC|nr:4Fe-4S dicluster domain-containing protein [Enteractinococcus fodinae]MDR7346169.1 formate dehydrogenase iron-sulfur subunit [Enteractinococcus fodinae]
MFDFKEKPGQLIDAYEDGKERKGFFTDTSICIGCKACEVACKEWNEVPMKGDLELLESSYDNTGGLGANTWRHVAFIEQDQEQIQKARDSGAKLTALGMPSFGAPEKKQSTAKNVGMPEFGSPGVRIKEQVDNPPNPDTPEFRWLMSSDVCKHCTFAGCLDVCPTGALYRTEHGTVVVQDDICNGCGTCVAGCPFGVIERRDTGTIHTKPDRTDSRYAMEVKHAGTAKKCTLCYDRLVDGQTPACAKTCPTESIKFGTQTDMIDSAKERVTTMHEQGQTEARLYGANPNDGVGGIGSVFLLLDEPEVYGLPPDPQVPTKDLPAMYKRVGIAAAGMLAAAATAFLGARKK